MESGKNLERLPLDGFKTKGLNGGLLSPRLSFGAATRKLADAGAEGTRSASGHPGFSWGSFGNSSEVKNTGFVQSGTLELNGISMDAEMEISSRSTFRPSPPTDRSEGLAEEKTKITDTSAFNTPMPSRQSHNSLEESTPTQSDFLLDDTLEYPQDTESDQDISLMQTDGGSLSPTLADTAQLMPITLEEEDTVPPEAPNLTLDGPSIASDDEVIAAGKCTLPVSSLFVDSHAGSSASSLALDPAPYEYDPALELAVQSRSETDQPAQDDNFTPIANIIVDEEMPNEEPRRVEASQEKEIAAASQSSVQKEGEHHIHETPVPFIPLHADEAAGGDRASTPKLDQVSQVPVGHNLNLTPQSKWDANSSSNPIDVDQLELNSIHMSSRHTLPPDPRLEAFDILDPKVQYLALVHPDLAPEAVENMCRIPLPDQDTDVTTVVDDGEKEGTIAKVEPSWGIRERMIGYTVLDGDEDQNDEIAKNDLGGGPSRSSVLLASPASTLTSLPDATDLTDVDGEDGETHTAKDSGSQETRSVTNIKSSAKAVIDPQAKSSLPLNKNKQAISEAASSRNPHPRKRKLIPELIMPPIPDWDPASIISLSDFQEPKTRKRAKSSGSKSKSLSKKGQKKAVEREVEPESEDDAFATQNEDMQVDFGPAPDMQVDADPPSQTQPLDEQPPDQMETRVTPPPSPGQASQNPSSFNDAKNVADQASLKPSSSGDAKSAVVKGFNAYSRAQQQGEIVPDSDPERCTASSQKQKPSPDEERRTQTELQPPPKRGRGRPRGSNNKKQPECLRISGTGTVNGNQEPEAAFVGKRKADRMESQAEDSLPKRLKGQDGQVAKKVSDPEKVGVEPAPEGLDNDMEISQAATIPLTSRRRSVTFIEQPPPVSPQSPHRRGRKVSISGITDADAEGEDALSHEIYPAAVKQTDGKGKRKGKRKGKGKERNDSPLRISKPPSSSDIPSRAPIDVDKNSGILPSTPSMAPGSTAEAPVTNAKASIRHDKPRTKSNTTARPKSKQKRLSTSTVIPYMPILEASPSTFHLIPAEFAKISSEEIAQNDSKFEGYDDSHEGLKRVCHHCRENRELNKMQCYNPREDRTYCHKQWCRPCINEWYLLEFDASTTGFICPYCQGICSCEQCRPHNGRGESPLPIDPYAPAITFSEDTRDAYEPPDHAKRAWRFNTRSWKIANGLAKPPPAVGSTPKVPGKRGRPRKVKVEEPSRWKLPLGEKWYIGKNPWKDEPDVVWEKMRAKVPKGRECLSRLLVECLKRISGKGRGRHSPLPLGHASWYVGFPPPLPEDQEAIPFLSSFATSPSPSPFPRPQPDLIFQPEHIPEFSYPDQTMGNHDSNIDPTLGPHLASGSSGPFRNYVLGHGAHMTLSGLQHLPLGFDATPFGGPGPSTPPGRYNYSPPHPHYHRFEDEDGHDTPQGNGEETGAERQEEQDDGWNSNIVYSFSQTDVTFPGEHDPESFRMAMEAGLSSTGITAVWKASQGELEVHSEVAELPSIQQP